ncbi:MAG: AMP-binding protein [Bryobacteraceae bacterium]
MANISHTSDSLANTIVAQLALHSRRKAVDQAGAATSYEELSASSFRVARAIRNVAPPSARILLALPSSASAYAGMVGSLIAGGTFCSINMMGPAARNAEISRAFAPDIVLFEKTPPPFVDALPVTPERVDTSRLGTETLEVAIEAENDVAYVVFTSGSTGTPKGVRVGRGAFRYFLEIAAKYFDLHGGERWAQFSNLGHDLGVMDIFMALTQGGTLVPLDDAERLRPGSTIRDRNLCIWQSVPSVIELMIRGRQLTADNLASLRVMSFCGEPLHPHHLRALFNARPDLVVFNTYGTTETTGFNTINRLTAENYADSCDAGAVSIGEDVPGWSIHLRGSETANEGEIVVASDHLSLGYWQDEDQTRAAFRDVDYGEGSIRRTYFTGDRGVRRGSRVYCSGRLDRQIKIHGERIELDEIDGRLREAGFNAAYTIFKDGELYSFVESAEEVDQERVRAQLRTALPFHAVPKSIRSLPALPRNPNGKIDREALARRVCQ